MIHELRCEGRRLHARFDPDKGLLEVKCTRKRCGSKPGVVVLHRFDIHTNELVDTVTFASPKVREEAHGTDHHTAAVRSA